MAHYYTLEGKTAYTVIGKNGKERGTTVRDAKVMQLVPSVTTIMSLQDKPMLVNWLQNQILEAAIASPFNDESWFEDGWKEFIIKQSKRVGERAAKKGNEIHDSMEHYFKTGSFDPNIHYTAEAVALIEGTFGGYEWHAEDSFAHADGFGGKVDLWGVNRETNEYVIVDFKTKDKEDISKIVQYDDHRIQLAAYQVGLKLPAHTRRFNLFISVHESSAGDCKLVECTKFEKYRGIFYALVNLWLKKYEFKLNTGE